VPPALTKEKINFVYADEVIGSIYKDAFLEIMRTRLADK
jgi:hypothetical protein